MAKGGRRLKKGNILIGALSLVIAVALWGYVALYINPEGDKTVEGIPVEFTNEKSLTGRDLMLVSGRNATVKVRFTGRMQDLAKIDKENLKAVVDLNSIGNADNYTMPYELVGPTELSALTAYKDTGFVRVSVDRVTSKLVDLSLDLQSETSADYMPGTAIFDPTRIKVTGPSKVVDTISSAVALYEQSQPITRTVEVRTNYTLYTGSGQIVDRTNLTVDFEEVWMTIPVSMVKSVPLTVTFIDGGGLVAEKHVSYEMTPSTVRISGDPDLLDGLNSISIATIDLSKLAGDITETYTITYPNGVRNIDDVQSAQASVHITGVSTRHIATNNITIKGLNLPDGYTYSFLTKQVTTTLRGPEADISQVASNNIRIVVDFSDVTVTATGLQSRLGTVYVDGFDSVGVVDIGYEVIIEILEEDQSP